MITDYANAMLEKHNGDTPKKKYERLEGLTEGENELLHTVASEFYRLGKYSGQTSETCFADNYMKIILEIENDFKTKHDQ